MIANSAPSHAPDVRVGDRHLRRLAVHAVERATGRSRSRSERRSPQGTEVTPAAHRHALSARSSPSRLRGIAEDSAVRSGQINGDKHHLWLRWVSMPPWCGPSGGMTSSPPSADFSVDSGDSDSRGLANPTAVAPPAVANAVPSSARREIATVRPPPCSESEPVAGTAAPSLSRWLLLNGRAHRRKCLGRSCDWAHPCSRRTATSGPRPRGAEGGSGSCTVSRHRRSPRTAS